MKQLLFLAAFAAIAVYGLYSAVNFYDKYMIVGRMRETPLVRPHEAALLIMENGTVPIEGGEELVRTALEHGSLPQTILSPERLLEFGKLEYQAFCSHCHGNNLDGQGTVGQSFNPLPTDLTGQRVTQMSDAEIFSTISYGTQRSPALASSMAVASRNAVIRYLRFRQDSK
jgi:hypothetical protein